MPRISEMQPKFILGMVTSMYRYEAKLINEPDLLTDAEAMDFYLTFMGGPL